MTRLIATTLAVALAIAAGPIDLVAAGRVWQNTGRIAGTATVDGKPLPLVRLRLRNIDNDTVVQRSRADGQGKYLFTDVPPANYVVETVSDDDVLIGVSSTVALSGAVMAATNVNVGASAAAAAAAGVATAAAAAGVGGAVAGAAAATGGVLGAVGGSLGVVAIAGGTIAAGAAIAARGDASPSS